MTKKNTAIQGDLSVSMGIRAGGDVNVKGNSVFNHDIEVKGWIKARNIMGACRGLFITEEKLKSTYPKPLDGWWALVGDTIPAEIYISENGEWKDSKKTGGEIGIYPDQIYEEINKIQSFLNKYYVIDGIADPSTTNEEAESEYGKFCYLAGPGTYTNLGGVTIPKGSLGIIKYAESWSVELISLTALIDNIYLDDKKDVALNSFIYEINVSLAFPTQGIDGTDKYDLQQAINTIFNNTHTTLKILSSKGTKCTFINKDGDVESWMYNKDGLPIDFHNWSKILDENIIPGKTLPFSSQIIGSISLDSNNTSDLFGIPINPDEYTDVSVIFYTSVSYQERNRTKGIFLLKYKKDGSYYYAINWKSSRKNAIMDSRNYNNKSIAISGDYKTQDYIRSIDEFSDTIYRGICGGNYYLNISNGTIIIRDNQSTDWYTRIIDVESVKNDLKEYKQHEIFMTEDEYDALEDKDDNKLYYLYEE